MLKTAMIFGAGFGKRLRPLTLTTPKPLLKINDTTCLERHIKALLDLGFEKIIVNTHHLSHKFEPIFKRFPNIVESFENEILETGGGVKNALHHFSKHTLCINGDVWFENYNFLKNIISSYTPNTTQLALIHKKNILFGDFQGDYDLESDGHIHARTGISSDYVYAGVQIFERRHFKTFADGKTHFSLKKYYDFCEEEACLVGKEISTQWCDIGTLDVYHKLNEYLRG